jgi:hypothetical protein
LSPRAVARKPAAVPDHPPVISARAKEAAERERREAAAAARRERDEKEALAHAQDEERGRPRDEPSSSTSTSTSVSVSKQSQPEPGPAGETTVAGAAKTARGHKDASVTWKDEVPGGEHRLTEGSPHAPLSSAKAASRRGSGSSSTSSGSGSGSGSGRKPATSRQQQQHAGRGRVGKKDPQPSKQRVQSSVSRAFTALEEPSPPVVLLLYHSYTATFIMRFPRALLLHYALSICLLHVDTN